MPNWEVLHQRYFTFFNSAQGTAWTLMTTYLAMRTADSERVVTDECSSASFLESMAQLYNIRCLICGGCGHTDKRCPTWGRMRSAALAHMQPSKWLNQALRTLQNDRKHAARLDGHAQPV